MSTSNRREEFLRQGYLVVADVVPAPARQNVIEAICEFQEIDLHDRETWYGHEPRGHGIVPLHHHQALWDIRQLASVYEVFAEVYGQKALWVTMDRVSFKPPRGEGHGRISPVHWDADPWVFNALSIQGLVYLTDTDEEQGAFACLPEIYQDLPYWLQEHEQDEHRRYPKFSDESLTKVPGKAGSLVLFHRLMPHTSALNQSHVHRFVQYVAMNPVGSEEERLRRVEEWQKKMPPQWAIKQNVPRQQLPEPGQPAVLNELGRKLLGVDAW